MLKIGAMGIMIISILIGLTSLFFMAMTSASENPIYNLGEKITIDIGDIGEYLLKIQTPAQTFVHKSDKHYFIFQPEIIGEYHISIKYEDDSKEIIFTVKETETTRTNKVYIPIEKIKLEQAPQIKNFTSEEPTDSQQIIVGKPVKWKQKIESSSEKISLKIPKSSENIKVTGGDDIQFKVKNSLVDSVYNLLSEEKQKSLLITNIEEDVEIEYTTPAPEKTEKTISKTKKEVTVSSEIHYENVIAFSEVNEITDNKEDIHIYWVEENKYLDFKTEDEDSDGLIDKVTWNIPHLSTQTFQIIIDIVDATHLDENRNFIENIYTELEELDGIWKQIPNEHYVRVTFEKELNFWNDITIYAKGNGGIEVYEKDSTKKIADFGEISSEGTYQIFLTELSTPQDTFDLKILGNIELDYIVDPTTTTKNPSAFTDSGNDWSNEGNAYADGGGYAEATDYKETGVVYYNYNFAIPAGSAIDSVRVRTDYLIEDADDYFNLDVSWDGGSTWSSAHALPNHQTEATEWTNVTSDTTWTISTLSNANFRVRMNAIKSGSAANWYRIDYIPVEVIYTEPVSALAVYLNLSDNFVSDSRTMNLTFTPTTGTSFINCSLWDNSTGIFAYNQTNSTSITNNTINSINKTYNSDDSFLWNIRCCDTTNCTFDSLNQTFSIDTAFPTVSLISPSDDNFTDSNQGINFTYSVTDAGDIANCSLIVDNVKMVTDTTITEGTTQNFDYFLSNGLHNWTINCTDTAGNENTTTPRSINVSVASTDWSARWYETSTSNYTSSAGINLANSRDSTENNVVMSVPADDYVTLVDAVSPYIGGDGAFITSGTVDISGVFSTDKQNQEYITWKVYISNSSGDTLICQSGDDYTDGTLLTNTNIGTYSPTDCVNPSNLSLQSTDRIRLIINAYNNFGSAKTVTHYWDDLRLSFIEFADFYSLGSVDVNMAYPTTDLNILSSDSFNITCEVNCIGGRCINTDVYVQYNTSTTAWTNIGASGNMILAGVETNPHSLGNVNSTSQITNFTIDANIDSTSNIRCIAESDYSDKNGTTIKEVIISAANQAPSVNLIDPEDNNWSNTNSMILYYNASDDNNLIANCSLYINGAFNRSNSTIVNDGGENNFTISGWTDGQYNWTVNCSDTTGLSTQPSERTFYIDTAFPQFILDYPGIDQIISQSGINFNFSVTDNLDSSLICNLTVDGSIIDPSFAATSGVYTNRTHSLTIGDHLWNVTCQDNAGNTNTSATQNFSIVDIPPTINLLTQDYNWFNTSSITLEYNTTDNNQIVNCSLYINGIFNQSNQTIINESDTNNFSISASDGIYNWTVNCSDDASLTTQPTEKNFYIDTIAPTVDSNLPANPSTLLYSDVHFNFTATDALGSINCNITINSQIADPSFSANNGSLTDRLISDLTDGEKYWNVTCWDQANNTNTSETRLVNITEYPSVILDTDDNESYNITTVDLYYTPTDNTNFSSCSLYINGVLNQTNQTTVINGAQNNFTLTAGSGYYNWSVSCTDLIGLTNQTSNKSFTVDLAKPTISLFAPTDEASIYNSLVNFNYSVNDDLDSNIDCNLTINGIVENQTIAIDEAYTIIPITFVQGGTKYWNVTCQDDAGNTNTSETKNFTLFLPPTVNLVYPDSDEWINISDITFIYNVSDGNDDILNASLILNGEANKSNESIITNNQENNFTLNGLLDGQYNWTVNVTDNEESTGTDTARTFYIDTQEPNVTLFSPAQDEVITTNNITFNFSAEDNLADELVCNLTIGDIGDPATLENFNVTNGSVETKYILRGDGNYTWFVECLDKANNYNISNQINFSVVAPPTVILDSPAEDSRTNLTTTNFEYTPYDAIGITKCDLYIDGVFNDTDEDIEKNVPNFFNGIEINEGEHNWTIECLDADLNPNSQSLNVFYIDLTPPAITLNSPDNDTGVDANNNILFNWTSVDTLDTLLTCDLIVDGVVEKNDVLTTSGFPSTESISGLSLGPHSWNVTCWDQVDNTNTSKTRIFNYTYPDFSINESGINFSITSPTEEESTTINATVYNLGGVDVSLVEINFYEGNPLTTGVQIGSTQEVSIDAFGSTTASVNWDATIGGAEIFVVSDPSNSFTELSESNNNASKNISVASWHFFYGDINSDSEFKLEDSTNSKIIRWDESNLTSANIYVTDYDSEIDWTSLQAIGKDTSGLNSTDDIIEIDSILEMTSFGDSLESLYLNGEEINETQTFLVFKNYISNVPVSVSINNSNFKTGILWDTSDDTNTEYDSTEKEDIIFITNTNINTAGTYGVTDYELRVPAKLREYNTTDQTTAAFYIEIN